MNSKPPSTSRTQFHEAVRRAARLGTLLPQVWECLPGESNRRLSPAGKGYVFCGPRWECAVGTYFAYFWIDVPEGVGSQRVSLDAVLWHGENATTLGHTVYPLQPGPKRAALFVLRFSVPEAGIIEVRAWSDESGPDLATSRVGVYRLYEMLWSMQGELKVGGASPPGLLDKILNRHSGGSLEGAVTQDYGADAPLDLWLAFGPKIGRILIQTTPASGRPQLVELAGITQQFSLDSLRSVLFVPRIAAVDCQAITLLHDQQQSDLELPRREIRSPRVLHRPKYRLQLRGTGRSEVRANGAAVRLRCWGIEEQINPASVDGVAPERTGTVVSLQSEDVVAFAPCSRAFFLFDTGPDCGIADLEWGRMRCHINLYEQTAASMIVFVPEDIVREAVKKGSDQFSGTLDAREQHGNRAIGDMVELFAIGHRHPAANSSEVAVLAVWPDYPLERIGHKQLSASGDFEHRWDVLQVRQGAICFLAGKMPAIELIRHDWGGICIVQYRGKLITVDTYGPVREQILVLPALDEPILSAHSRDPSRLDGSVVSPALANFFQRRRPPWLSADQSRPG